MHVYITRPIPPNAKTILQEKGYTVTENTENRVLSKEELLQHIKEKNALLTLLTDNIDGEIMDAGAPTIKIIANYAVGFDNIDIEAATKRNIFVTNTPKVSTESVAEHTIALMFAISRKIVEADKFTRAGKYEKWDPTIFLGSGIENKTLGVIGLGRIGCSVVRRAQKGLGMKILYHDIKRNDEFEKEFSAVYKEKDELLQEADFISLHVPLLPATRHFIGEKELRAMKQTAYLINTSRGPVVDEQALVNALQLGDIKGAAIDVYEHEPKLTPGLTELDNIVLTPHIASATEETREAMGRMAAENIIAALEGKTPPNIAK